MLRVIQIPALIDNFIYVLIDDKMKEAAVIDPAEAENVLSFLKKENLTLTKIFNTHHHADHVGGNIKLIEYYPNAAVYAGVYDKGRIPLQKHFLNHDDTITFGDEEARIYYVPGHTLGHIAYHFKLKNSEEYLFIGDTIFGGGCGKLFEGSFSQMFHSLKFIRDHVSDRALVFCTHEYTIENYTILAKLEPENKNIANKLKQAIETRKNNLYTVPFTLGEEKKSNSFLRWDDKDLKKVTKTDSDLDTFTFVRKFRDRY